MNRLPVDQKIYENIQWGQILYVGGLITVSDISVRHFIVLHTVLNHSVVAQ